MEEFALESHTARSRAIDEGRFEHEIVPLGDFDTDEGPRDTSLEKMAALPPLVEGGRITAAVASQISDASSALLVASEQRRAGPRADPARPHPPPLGARRRPGLDADRPDPRHRGTRWPRPG